MCLIRSLLDSSLAYATLNAGLRSAEVTPEDLLIGCLQTLSRFGVVLLGDLAVDLKALSIEVPLSETSSQKSTYSQEVLTILRLASDLALADGAEEPSIEDVLACFSDVNDGLMGTIKQSLGIDGLGWRLALARNYAGRRGAEPIFQPVRSEREQLRRETPEYLSPEEAAILLGVHEQTVRGYIRSGKLPALRVDRVLRIRSADVSALLEPLQPKS